MSESYDLDTSQIGDPNDIHNQPGRVEPGCGMAMVTLFEGYADGQNAHDISIEIVAWTDNEQVGKIHRERVFLNDNSGKGWPQKVLTNWGLATGMFTADHVRECQAKNQFAKFTPDKMIGVPVMVRIIEEPDRDNPTKYTPACAA